MINNIKKLRDEAIAEARSVRPGQISVATSVDACKRLAVKIAADHADAFYESVTTLYDWTPAIVELASREGRIVAEAMTSGVRHRSWITPTALQAIGSAAKAEFDRRLAELRQGR